MGAVFSRKKKPEPTTLEKLEKIETKIKVLDDLIQQDRRREKKIWATFLFSTGFIYVSIAGFLHLFVLKRQTVLDYAKLAAIWIAPVVIIYFILQRFIPWYFSRGIQEYRANLKRLRDEKKKILDSVRETEPYNKAKTILEKYEGPQGVPPTQKPAYNPNGPRSGPPSYQKMPITPYQPRGAGGAGGPPRPTYQPGAVGNPPPAPYQGSPQFPMGRPPQLRERGAFDRVLDYIVKDGPENRMALICRGCGAHNGLCLLDEYDFTGFRCFECRLPNPPRKPRPSMVNVSLPYAASRNTSMTTPGSASLQEASGSESETSSGSEGEPAVYQATVKKPPLITTQESQTAVPAMASNLAESDTGSESGDEMEGSAAATPTDRTEVVSGDSLVA